MLPCLGHCWAVSVCDIVTPPAPSTSHNSQNINHHHRNFYPLHQNFCQCSLGFPLRSNSLQLLLNNFSAHWSHNSSSYNKLMADSSASTPDIWCGDQDLVIYREIQPGPRSSQSYQTPLTYQGNEKLQDTYNTETIQDEIRIFWASSRILIQTNNPPFVFTALTHSSLKVYDLTRSE